MYLIPIVFIILLISGTAFAYLMGAVSVLTFVALDKSQFLSILPQRIFAQLDVFAFMAMPLFILTAEIMTLPCPSSVGFAVVWATSTS